MCQNEASRAKQLANMDSLFIVSLRQAEQEGSDRDRHIEILLLYPRAIGMAGHHRSADGDVDHDLMQKGY